MKLIFSGIYSFFLFFPLLLYGQKTYTIENGKVHFTSDAPLELIQASSNELKGIIDFANGTFAFTIPVSSFKGFNSTLQQEHFNENYMETQEFPRAVFQGKIIENINPDIDSEHEIRAKGKLLIHGVEQERIIRAKIKMKGGQIDISSSFSVFLREHDITIPKVVHQKIAEEINIKLKATAIAK